MGILLSYIIYVKYLVQDFKDLYTVYSHALLLWYSCIGISINFKLLAQLSGMLLIILAVCGVATWVVKS